jgi:hypothetical protein
MPTLIALAYAMWAMLTFLSSHFEVGECERVDAQMVSCLGGEGWAVLVPLEHFRFVTVSVD